jgi:hypothetical protein
MIVNQTKLYEKEKNELLNHHPGKAHVLFISWEEFAESVDFDHTTEIASCGVSEANLVDYAFTKTRDYISQIEEEFDETQILEMENKYLEALKKHWSLQNILLRHIKLKEITEGLNTWAQTGPKHPQLFVIQPKPGFAVTYFINNIGISFTIYETFMIPHTELYYEQSDSLPEWNFEDITAEDVVETYLSLEIHNGNPIIIDLSDWHEKL